MGPIVFQRLLSLYKENTSQNKTAIEDYTTEALAGVLENNQQLLDQFVNEILRIGGDDFTVKTQKRYPLENDVDCIVDMVFFNADTYCFLENKVDSGEGYRQLERYRDVLMNMGDSRTKRLRYCTKHFDPKDRLVEEADSDIFKQFRWRDVYTFFQEHCDDSLVQTFVMFLKEAKIMGSEKFNDVDIVSLNHVFETFSKIEECLTPLRKTFKSYFGGYQDRSLNQLLDHQRYPIIKKEIIARKRSEIYAAFHTTETPLLYVKCGVAHENHKREEFEQLVEQYKERLLDCPKTERTDWGYMFHYEKPLSDFLSSPNQMKEIQEWFEEKLWKIKKFQEVTPELNWTIETG